MGDASRSGPTSHGSRQVELRPTCGGEFSCSRRRPPPASRPRQGRLNRSCRQAYRIPRGNSKAARGDHACAATTSGGITRLHYRLYPMIDTHFHVWHRADPADAGILATHYMQRDFTWDDFCGAWDGLPVERCVEVQVKRLSLMRRPRRASAARSRRETAGSGLRGLGAPASRPGRPPISRRSWPSRSYAASTARSISKRTALEATSTERACWANAGLCASSASGTSRSSRCRGWYAPAPIRNSSSSTSASRISRGSRPRAGFAD